MQSLGKPPGGIYFIKSLATIPNWEKVLFKNQPLEERDDQFHPDETTNFVACDIQMMHSQGVRSEIVEISAIHVQDRSKVFHTSCYGHHEDFLNLPHFKPVNESLKEFLGVILFTRFVRCGKEKFPAKNVIDFKNKFSKL